MWVALLSGLRRLVGAGRNRHNAIVVVASSTNMWHYWCDFSSRVHVMRLYSSPESIANGEASALAILETVLAVAAYWGFAWYFDTYLYLLISVTVAPFAAVSRAGGGMVQGLSW